MPGRYKIFNRDALSLEPLANRRNLVTLDDVLALGQRPMPFEDPALGKIADAIANANANGAAVVLMMGAHVIKQGLSRYLVDLIRRKCFSVVAMNGACAIHDYELAAIGATSESVSENIKTGRFGMWRETGAINDIVSAGAAEGLGFGEAVGRHIAESDLPNKDLSVFAAAYEADVPATVHVGIGYDIIHQHPNFCPAAAGMTSYHDFLTFARIVENLEGGVVLCYGTAVMGPEVYLKALSMARNVAAGRGEEISHFTAAVFDLVDLGSDLSAEAPKDSPEYYYRPFKTVLVRTVRDGGTAHYIRGDHRATLPALHALITER